MAGLRVLKFGGSSLGSRTRLAQVCGIVSEEQARGPLALVVSAFGDTTDWLLAAVLDAERADRAAMATRVRAISELAAEVSGAPLHGAVALLVVELKLALESLARRGQADAAARDSILSFGERISAQLVAARLREAGIDAAAVDAREWLVTDERHADASVLWEQTRARLTERRVRAQVEVHTGFIGATVSGKTTTLGRNGSDYTAALLARGQRAEELVVYTDVPGILTADPALVSEAYPVPELSYREALELAGLGLRMLHPRTILPLLEAGIPMRVRDTMRKEAPGTTVSASGSGDPRRPTCVTSLADVCLIDVEGTQHSLAAQLGPRVATALANAGVTVWLETQAPRGNGVALVVPAREAEAALAAIREALARDIETGAVLPPRAQPQVTLLTLVAEAMGKTVNVAGRLFAALGTSGVNVRAAAQGATSRAISAVIDQRDAPVAVRAVHAAFNLASEQVNLLLLGRGTVGGNLLQQLASEAPKLRKAHDLDLRLAGLVALSGTAFDAAGLDPVRARRMRLLEAEPIEALIARVARLPVPVLCDCTAADGMEEIYALALRHGVHVVTANKKVLTLPSAERARVFAAAKDNHRAFRYETTVGAGLPVIETLKNLVRTGDEIQLVEGSLSGTLGFLSNAVMRGQPLAEAVREAQALGFTEPLPKEDLGGIDAARKCLILAREIGLEVELADVEVEPFVPASVVAPDDLGAFYASLEAYGPTFAARIAKLRNEGRVLRYLASIKIDHDGRATLRVGPVDVPADHPATRLAGAEAFVAFTTARYSQPPLVVQGAGAGGAVTAAGVLSDILALSQTLRGR